MQRQLELINLSSQRRKSLLGDLGVAIPVAAITLSLQGFINTFLAAPYFFLFFPAGILVAWNQSYRSAVITVVLCILGADFFYFEPRFAFRFRDLTELVALSFVGAASIFSSWAVGRLRSREDLAKIAQTELATTLTSIGDGVIVVNAQRKVAFLNPVAEKLTGWKLDQARGVNMDVVFNIINEKNRLPAANPVDRVLQEGIIVGLANHTVLISKDGIERPIEDSAAPIVMAENKKTTGVVLVFRDVSETYKAESRARESEERLKLALASAKMGTFFIDLRTQQVTTSPELSKILGFDEYKGNVFESIDKLIHPADRERTAEVFRNSIEKRIPYENEYRIVRPNGEVRWILSRANLILGHDNQPVAVSGVTVDVHDLKVAEGKVRASEKRFSALFHAAPLATAISALPEGKIVDVNPAFLELFEYSEDDILGKTSAEIGLYPDPAMRKILYDEILSKGRVSNMEVPFKTKSGKILIASLSVNVVHLDGIAHALTSLVDVTKVRETEKLLREKEQAELRESERRFRELLDALPQMAWSADPSGNFYWYNERWYKFTGTDFEEMQGWGWQKVQHPDYQDRVMQWWEETIEIGESREMEFPIRRADGNYRWFLSRAVPIKDHSGQVIAWCGTNTDIHEQKNLQQSLMEAKLSAEKAKEEAELATALKSAFLANMSHEIRTPLGAMIGFADLLRDPGLTESERQNYIDILVRNGENLAVIINDILDLSKVEAGHLTLEFAPVKPVDITEDVVSLLRVKAKEKDLVLEYSIEDSTPEWIVTDQIRLRQILMNIIGNAVKFTQYGSVHIRSFGCPMADGGQGVCFEVKDTGIGIPPSQKEKIFEMFVQADGSMTRRFGGTGLGLALSRRLARALGGNIEVTMTEPGKGSNFLITVKDQPEQPVPAPRLTTAKPVSVEFKADTLKGLNILVVDDAPDNRHLIWRLLTKYGAVVEAAENGLLGYRQAMAGNYDVVLMDIQMPEMDGYTATHKLRASGFRRPIIALTAHAMSDVRQKCLNVGCTGHLPKPIVSKDLIAKILEFTDRAP